MSSERRIRDTHVINIPEEFAASIRRREGDAGRTWLGRLPAVVAELCQRWSLGFDGAPMHGHLAIVVPVRRHGVPCALKVSWQDGDTVHESRALRLWNGRNMVQVLEASSEYGAMLLERLDAGRTLFDVPIEDAVPIAGEMIRNLSVPGDARLPTAASLAARIARTVHERWDRLGRPIPLRLIEAAFVLSLALAKSMGTTMVNWDLHYGNILFSPSRQQWIAIDPKPVVGAPESGVAQLFWTRISDVAGPSEFDQYLDSLIETAGMEPELTRDWIWVRVVDFWLWELGVGLGSDPGGCAKILDWLEDR